MSTLTFRDVIERVTDYLGGNVKESEARAVRRAISDAYRDLSDQFAWRSLHKFYIFTLNARYDTGTVAYDLTGGAYERLWTGTGTTFPTWADRGTIRVGSNNWPVRYRSGTQLQSPADIRPASDISSTSYVLYQDEYLLPEDFMSMGVGIPGNLFSTLPSSQQTVTWLNRTGPMSGTPLRHTIVADRLLPGRLAIKLEGFPSTSQTFGMLYRRRPRPLKYTGYASRDRGGTVSISGTTVTGSGTAFETAQAGSIIRISANATEDPTDDGGNNPAVYEGVIREVVSSSSLTVEANESGVAKTSVKYTISDPIDYPDTMINALLRNCELHVEISRQRDDAARNMAMELFSSALLDAKAADKRSFAPENLLSSYPHYFHNADPDYTIVTDA